MSHLSGNEHLVDLLRAEADALEREINGRASRLRVASDAIVALTAALEGLVRAVERDTAGFAAYSAEMKAARAVLARVRAGTEAG